MALNYDVRPNNIKKGTWYPRVVTKERITYKRLLKDIEKDTLVTEPDARAVISAFTKRIAEYLSHGHVLEIGGLVEFSISLSEELPSRDSVVSDAVQVRVNARTDEELAQESRKDIIFEKVRVRGRRPELDSFHDARTGDENAYTPGSVIKIKGDDLKFDIELTDEGVFFVAVETGALIRADTYSRQGSQRIDCMVPSDMVGKQYVELHTRHGTQEMRTSRLKAIVQPVA